MGIKQTQSAKAQMSIDSQGLYDLRWYLALNGRWRQVRGGQCAQLETVRA